MKWDRLAAGTRLWRNLILADVVLHVLGAIAGGFAAASGGVQSMGSATWVGVVALVSAIGVFITSALRIRVGQHWRNGPSEFKDLSTAYFTLAIISVIVTVSYIAMALTGLAGLLRIVNGVLTVAMMFVALHLQKRGARAVMPAHAVSFSQLSTGLIFLMLTGVLGVVVPIVLLLVLFGFLFWLNKLTKLLKEIAEDYEARTDVADTFD